MRYSRICCCLTFLAYFLFIWIIHDRIKIYSSNQSINTVFFDDLLNQCINTVFITGVLLNKHYNKQSGSSNADNNFKKVQNHNSDNIWLSPVTNVDKLSECSILADLKQWFPSVKVFSEERVDCSRLTAVRQFLNEFKNLELLHPFDKTYLISSQAFDVEHIQLWLDPLDASQEFMEGIFDCASIMLCICHKGTPIAGVMYFPFTKQLYWGLTTQDGRNLYNHTALSSLDMQLHDCNYQLQSADHPGNSRIYKILISRSHSANRSLPSASELEHVLGTTVVFELLGGSGFKAAKVMDNMKNANESYVYLHLSEIMFWDLATINAIAKARGLWMSDRHGQAINYPVDPDSTDFVHRTGVLLCEQEVAEIFLNSNLLKTVTRRYPLTKL